MNALDDMGVVAAVERMSGLSRRGEVAITWADTIKPRRLEWIWKHRLARGKLTVDVGDPGAGKGTRSGDTIARITTGSPFPDGEAAPLGKVFVLSAEDDAADTIVPRLHVAGADCSRVGIIGRVPDGEGGERRIDLSVDQEMVVRVTAEGGGILLVIDPLSSFLGSDVNSWRDSDVRRVLDPLAEAAARYGVAVLLVAHLNKSAGRSAMYRVAGSVATIAAARFGFLIAPHPDDPELRVYACIKSNLAQKPASLTFRIMGRAHPELDDEIGCVEWVGTSPLTADALVSGDAKKDSQAVSRAESFLKDYLGDGWRTSLDVKAAAKAEGVGQHSIWEAKSRLGIQAKKDGLGQWLWGLPAKHSSEDEEGSEWEL